MSGVRCRKPPVTGIFKETLVAIFVLEPVEKLNNSTTEETGI
jgi:hypothetical protein